MWINPECDRALGIAVSVTVQALEAAFATAAARQLKVGAVLVVSPSYFGSCSDIAGGHACPCLSTLLEQARKMFLYVHPQSFTKSAHVGAQCRNGQAVSPKRGSADS